MQKHQNKIFWALILSESTHVFCCVLPTVFSVLSLFAGLGLIGVMPSFIVDLHALFHAWEVPMLIASGLILALGWWLYRFSRRIDCHDTGCHHGPCNPSKNKVSIILMIATGLFVVNLFVYTVFHRGMSRYDIPASFEQEHDPAHEH
jgi:hypothetical protein